MKRIHWTPEESLAVATRVFEQLRPSRLEDLRGAQILAAVRAAQSELLPDVRQRVFTSMFNVASLMPYLKSVFINGKAQDEEKEQMAEPKAQELTPVELALADRIVQRLLDPDSTLADRLAGAVGGAAVPGRAPARQGAGAGTGRRHLRRMAAAGAAACLEAAAEEF